MEGFDKKVPDRQVEKLSPLGEERRALLRGAIAAAGAVALIGLPLEDVEAAPRAKNARETQPGIESGEKDIAQRYTQAREYMRTHRTPNDTAIIYFPFTDKDTGELRREIDIGTLNTRTDYQVVEERGAYRILQELGFPTVEGFARAYNEQFKHRSDSDKEQLMQNADIVDAARAARKDIKIGDKAFQQVRLALGIYVIDNRLQTKVDKTVSYAKNEFTVDELGKYGITPQHVLLAGSSETALLRTTIDFVKSKEYAEMSRLGVPLKATKKLGPTYVPAENESTKSQIQSFVGKGKLDAKSIQRLTDIIEDYNERNSSGGSDGILVAKVLSRHPELKEILERYERARSLVCQAADTDIGEDVQNAFNCEEYSSGP